MESIRAVLTRHWRIGALAFLIAMALCSVSVWRRQARYNLVFTFSAPTITHRIQLPSLRSVYPQSIVDRLRLALAERSLNAVITQNEGAFTVIVDSLPQDATDQVEQQFLAIYRDLTDQLSRDVDPAPLSGRLSVLDARLDLIAQTLSSPNLSTYDRYALEDRAIELRAQRADVHNELEIVSGRMLDAPARQLYRAQQMDAQVLYVLSFVLSGFVAAATMLLADSLRGDRLT